MDTSILWSLFFGAVVVETIVNIVRNIEATRNGSPAGWQYWASLGVGLAVGLIVAINYNIDVFTLVGLEGKVPIIGAILTGLIISRGSNIVNDVVDRLNSWRSTT
jgi:hypothetical protein